MIQQIEWAWEEAFCKFGFDDGDGWNGTYLIQEFIEKEFGYTVEADTWGIHNYMIFSIKDKKGKELLDEDKLNIEIGYTDPKDYLPKEMIKKLDKTFPSGDIF
tara:strand:- start:11440 stop:11748 length:309 start_codon:yes stop_codon:yes gene_type:complete